jgi:magnesium-protoporphyrin O-methyltransferase
VTTITDPDRPPRYAWFIFDPVKGTTFAMYEQLDQQSTAPKLERSSLFRSIAQSDTSKRVSKYFESSGFSRWTAIYGDGGIPPIWTVIRDGHRMAINTVIEWVKNDTTRTALDAGCGTGTLALALADQGYEVDGFDQSAPMVSYARYSCFGRTKGIQPHFQVGDIAALAGDERSYDLVCCLDVLFHYPYDEVKVMLENLAKISSHKLIGSFAVKTSMNSLWMMIGKKFFHQKNRMTSLHLLSYDEVEQVLYRAGFQMKRTRRVKKFFYDSFIFEAVRA